MDDERFKTFAGDVLTLEGVAVGRRVCVRSTVNNVSREVEVEGYDADEAVEIVRDLERGKEDGRVVVTPAITVNPGPGESAEDVARKIRQELGSWLAPFSSKEGE